MNFDTPLYKFTDELKSEVYEPAEDTFLLLDALTKDYQNLAAVKPSICLEIGCGSGLVTVFLAKITAPSYAHCFCTDISPQALNCTLAVAELNGFFRRISPVLTNFADGFSSQLTKKVDVLVFNPPYVPTERLLDDFRDTLTRTWSGGVRGREVVDKFLPKVPRLLAKGGIFYLIAVKENNLEELLNFFDPKEFQSEILLNRRVRNEYLHVLKFDKL